jgi:hypothetical protein
VASIREFPPALPAALVAGHGFQPVPNARQRERDQGEVRLRPRYRSSPEVCSASWLFDQDQFDAFHDWFEDELQAGSLDFDVRVQHRGTEYGTTWYTAVFLQDYAAEVLHPMLYRVTAPLLLRTLIGPVRTAPSIQALGRLAFSGGAAFGAYVLSARGGISLSGGAYMGSPPLQARGGIAFAGGGPVRGAALAVPRETDDSVERETDSGFARDTD